MMDVGSVRACGGKVREGGGMRWGRGEVWGKFHRMQAEDAGWDEGRGRRMRSLIHLIALNPV